MSPVRPTSASSPRLPPDSAVGGPFREVLSLDRLVTDAGTQIRSAIDDDVVDEYVQALADGAQFPPVVVFRADGAEMLADGFTASSPTGRLGVPRSRPMCITALVRRRSGSPSAPTALTVSVSPVPTSAVPSSSPTVLGLTSARFASPGTWVVPISTSAGSAVNLQLVASCRIGLSVSMAAAARPRVRRLRHGLNLPVPQTPLLILLRPLRATAVLAWTSTPFRPPRAPLLRLLGSLRWHRLLSFPSPNPRFPTLIVPSLLRRPIRRRHVPAIAPTPFSRFAIGRTGSSRWSPTTRRT